MHQPTRLGGGCQPQVLLVAKVEYPTDHDLNPKPKP